MDIEDTYSANRSFSVKVAAVWGEQQLLMKRTTICLHPSLAL